MKVRRLPSVSPALRTRTSRLLIALVFCGLALYPWLYGKYLTTVLTQWLPDTSTAFVILAFTVMGLGLNFVVGYAGLLDLGYVAFFAAGAYVAGWLASEQFASAGSVSFGGTVLPGTPGIHLSPWLVILIAAIFSAILGVVIGVPTLRLRGDYLAIVTLGFGEIIPQFVRNGDNLGGFNLTNGSFGLNGIDGLGFGNKVHHAIHTLPANFLNELDSRWYYWTALALVVVTILSSILLRDSRLGRAWIAIREDEDAAAAMGVPLMRTKTLSYAIGAFFGGAAGALITLQAGATSPDAFSLQVSIFVLCMVILGGIGNVWGVTLGGILLAYVNYKGLFAAGNTFNSTFGTNVDVPEYSYLIYGVAIVLFMLVRPEGLIPSARRRAELVDEPEEENVAAEGAPA
ncbi:MAG TPA: branched-chain amino acid ABC transporter permease [Gaiellaceae bacterium]|nr:branched-chain amino acid ABC transporter permease [Gaiellaceae bacterium]